MELLMNFEINDFQFSDKMETAKGDGTTRPPKINQKN